jgi:hypothetical protein
MVGVAGLLADVIASAFDAGSGRLAGEWLFRRLGLLAVREIG